MKNNDDYKNLESYLKENLFDQEYAVESLTKTFGIKLNYFAIINNRIKPHIIILEKNFDYDNVSKAFKHLPVKYVFIPRLLEV